MLHICLGVAMMALSTSVIAEEMKGIKVGTGCIGPVTKVAGGITACVIEGAIDYPKARTWCPNGQIHDRRGELPRVSLARSICNLSQIP